MCHCRPGTPGSAAPSEAADFVRADMNGDCELDLADLALVNTYLGQSRPVPLIQFNWDAENRLVSTGPRLADGSLER